MRNTLPFYGLLLSLVLLCSTAMAQDTLKKIQKKSPSKISKSAKKLEVALDENNEAGIAASYEALAQGFIDKKDFPKAEEYLKKALASYTKLNSNADMARVNRSIAKVQESQKKFNSARLNYKIAKDMSEDKVTEKINDNDLKRLQNADNPKAQEEFNRDNIDLLSKESKKEEVAEAYKQKAEINVQQNKKKDAIESYKKAISYSKEKPAEVIKYKSEIAKVYASDNQFDKAITIHENLYAEAVKKGDFNTQIKQLQSIANVYFQKDQPEEAISSLRKAYDLAFQNGNTAEVKNSLSQLILYYKSNGNAKESMALYDRFLNNFDQLIKSDSTLIDAKTFQVTEEKIRQLEKEKILKDELISKKNTFNYFLLVSVVLLLLFFGFIVRAWYAIKIKNKEIALQSLRREMNPHFIFNSLNSVNQFISQNNEREANKYLTSYSDLMRSTMENSNKDFVSLNNEIEQLTTYLNLEHMRFSDKFDYKITVAEELDTEGTFVPNMIIQPHLENAIWHGLRYLEQKGMLLLSFRSENGKIIVTIDDNGIGLSKSKELKTENQKVHQSRGITNTKERIGLLTELYKKGIVFTMVEKQLPAQGTIVTIVFPLINRI